MGRKSKVDKTEPINLTDNKIEIKDYKDCRLTLVMALNALLKGKITPAQNKSIAYSIQCILTALNKEHDSQDDNCSSINALVELIKEQRDNQADKHKSAE